MHDKHGLLSAPIPTVLRQMTIPMIFGLVAILMFNLVDTFLSLYWVQRRWLRSATPSQSPFIVNCITMGIGIGLSTNIGRLLGQGSANNVARFSSHGILLAVVLVIVASSIGFITIELLLLLGAARAYPAYRAIYAGVVSHDSSLVVPMTGNSVIRATGDTKTPAKIMMLAGIINGVLDPMLIFGYGRFWVRNPRSSHFKCVSLAGRSDFALSTYWLKSEITRCSALPEFVQRLESNLKDRDACCALNSDESNLWGRYSWWCSLAMAQRLWRLTVQRRELNRFWFWCWCLWLPLWHLLWRRIWGE